MGTYRLFLAYLVAFGHMHAPIAGTYGVGVSAVISFFLLSGFVMTGMIQKYYLRFSSIPAFYVERILRLGPQFYFYSGLMLTLAWAGIRHDFLVEMPSGKSLFLQFLGVPLDFYRYFLPNMLLPQAWSLGLELIFYSVFPIILICGMRFWAASASLVVYLIAYSGFMDGDLWTYRYLPGTLFIFICGSFLFTEASRQERMFVTGVWTLALFLFGLTYFRPELGSLWNRSVLLGLIVGIPMVKLLKPFSQEAPSGKTFDGLAGNLSYGVFLALMAVIGVMQTWGVDMKTMSFGEDVVIILIVFAVSTLLSFVSFNLVEMPLIARRRRSRRKELAVAACVSPVEQGGSN